MSAILFLEKAAEDSVEPILDRREVAHLLLLHVIRPLVKDGWWESTLDLVAGLVREVPAYRLRFNRSGRVVDLLELERL
jgi:hypothetical protein